MNNLMEPIYLIWSNSFELDDISTCNKLVYITKDYYKALCEFNKYKKLCKETYNDPKWCYSYSLHRCFLDTFPLQDDLLYEIDNIID